MNAKDGSGVTVDGRTTADYSHCVGKKPTPRPWLDARLRELGKSKIDLARALGINNSRVHELIAGTRRVQLDEIDPMSRFLEWTRPQTLAMLSGVEGGASEVTVVTTELGYDGTTDLPVFAAVDMGGGLFTVSEAPVRFSERPPSLRRIKSAYAVFCVHDAMSPAYERGDLLIIDPTEPVAPGHNVLFTDRQGNKCIRRLVEILPESWRVKQFNPARTYSLPIKDWPSAQKVFGARFR